MLLRVVIAGCTPVLSACCSAGRPKASQPMGCRTLKPRVALVAGDDVRRDVAQRVSDVQARAAGVREEVEHVPLGQRAVLARPEGAALQPAGLPLGLDGAVVVEAGGLLRGGHRAGPDGVRRRGNAAFPDAIREGYRLHGAGSSPDRMQPLAHVAARSYVHPLAFAPPTRGAAARDGRLAQLVERLDGIQEVRGSTPLPSTSVPRAAAR